MRIILILFLLASSRLLSATYYIDFATGADAQNGTAKATPWKHHPYMTGWTGSYSHSAGDRFIFKGGVTWDHTCWPMNISTGGGSGNRDYYGVDMTWYTGGSFARPIFDGEYVSLNAHNCYVTGNYVEIDNIEMKRKNCSSISTAPALLSINAIGWLVTNVYLHGWKTTSVTDDAFGGFVNATTGLPSDCALENSEIENSENAPNYGGVCIRSVPIIHNCRIHDNSSGILDGLDIGGDPSLYSPTHIYNIVGLSFDPTYHYNGAYIDPVFYGQTVGYIRNCYIYDVSNGANMAYPQSRGATCYIYNNVFYGTQTAQLPINIDTYDFGSGTGGVVYVYNNTANLQASSSFLVNVTAGASNPRPPLDGLHVFNNHVIGTSAGLVNTLTFVTSYTNGTNLIQSPATATSQGYVLGNLYAPTSTSVGTYNTGTDESGTLTTDILSISRPQASIWDIGAYEFVSSGSTGGSTMTGKISLLGKVTIK